MGALDLREALYYRLTNYAGLTSLVSTRIYPDNAPQKAALPYVVFELSGGPVHHAHGSDADTYAKIVLIYCHADDGDEVYDITVQARGALKDYSGNMAGAGDTFTVQRIFVDGEPVYLTDIDPETNVITYQSIQTFVIWHY